MTERIPREELDRAARRLARHVAAVLLQAMAELDVSFEMIDARLDARPGSSRRYLMRLADGRGDMGLRTLAHLALGIGVEVNISLAQREGPSTKKHEENGRIEDGGETRSETPGQDDGATS